MEFVDRILKCADCNGDFIFTAGEQLFFFDKQFKNDPKRCKPCKSKRSGAAAQRTGAGPAAAGLARTETRTACSECGIETTVPFKPTQNRPVLCRQCFQNSKASAAALSAVALSSVAISAESPSIDSLPIASLTVESDAAPVIAAEAIAGAPSIDVAPAVGAAAVQNGVAVAEILDEPGETAAEALAAPEIAQA